MNDAPDPLLSAIHEIRDLVRLIAEPQIAARDKTLREALLEITGKGTAKRAAVLLMNGNHTQTDIHRKCGIQKGNLSILVKTLGQAGLLEGDPKHPKLSIPITVDFLERATD